jgi:hypothetical protein
MNVAKKNFKISRLADVADKAYLRFVGAKAGYSREVSTKMPSRPIRAYLQINSQGQI